jgi:hypothetical protein
MSSLYESGIMPVNDKTNGSRMTVWLKLGIAAVVLSGVAAVCSPFIRTAYKRHKAEEALTATKNDQGNLTAGIGTARQLLKGNAFIMTGSDETGPLETVIAEAEAASKDTGEVIGFCEGDFNDRAYDRVRQRLDESFGLEQGTRQTPRSVIAAHDAKLKQVIDYCQRKRTSRDTVVRNEWYLKARLKTPIVQGVEKEPKLAPMPQEFYDLIPLKTPALDNALTEFPVDLNNSMGVALSKRKSRLEHILTSGASQSVKSNAQTLYNGAQSSFCQVRALNDALIWYRGEKHDGTFQIGRAHV